MSAAGRASVGTRSESRLTRASIQGKRRGFGLFPDTLPLFPDTASGLNSPRMGHDAS